MKVGDLVSWKSQAGGNTKVKTGKVVAVVPAAPGLPSMLKYFIPLPLTGSSSVQFDGFQRNHECYIVAVEPESGRGQVKLYCPRVSALKVVEG